MEHALHPGGGALAGRDIANIALNEFRRCRYVFAPPIHQAVQRPHAVTAFQQALAKMTADESRAAGDQNILHDLSLYSFWKKARSSGVLMPRASVASATSRGVKTQPCAAR